MQWIHDVSTDVGDPPHFVALLPVRRNCKNGVDYSGPREPVYSHITPQIFAMSTQEIFPAALAAAKAMRWHIADAVPAEGRIEATATTRLMRFKDDVVIRIRDHERGALLDIRSASRVGSSDFGANAKRIRVFLSKLNNLLKTDT